MKGVRVTWYLNGAAVDFGSESPFERASPDSSVLRTRGKVDKRAHGVYSCQAENEVRCVELLLQYIRVAAKVVDQQLKL